MASIHYWVFLKRALSAITHLRRLVRGRAGLLSHSLLIVRHQDMGCYYTCSAFANVPPGFPSPHRKSPTFSLPCSDRRLRCYSRQTIARGTSLYLPQQHLTFRADPSAYVPLSTASCNQTLEVPFQHLSLCQGSPCCRDFRAGQTSDPESEGRRNELLELAPAFFKVGAAASRW